jgi:hypothetical protein
MARKPTDYVQVKIRMREALRRKLEREAQKKAISTNAEALERIERTLEEEERWDAHYKEMEERKDELEAEEREWHAEQARERAEHEAALRDSRILSMLIGGDENAELLRSFVLGLGNNPNWAATPESRHALADKIHNFVLTHKFKKPAPEKAERPKLEVPDL